MKYLHDFAGDTIGTFILVFFGCGSVMAAVLLSSHVGLFQVAAIICIIAPLTQAGLNPAGDLSPRIFAYLAGWGQAAFPDARYGFLSVYVIGPLVGGITASLLFTKILHPLMVNKRNQRCKCG